MRKVFILVVVISLMAAGVALGTVVSSKHDMRFEDTANQSDATQVCEFCHHPHRGEAAGAYDDPLLWNKKYDINKTYAPYQSTATLNGSPATVDMGDYFYANGLYATALCMSCHDGANASMGLVRGIRQPSGNNPVTALDLVFDFTASNLGTTLADDHPVNFSYTDYSDDDIPGTVSGGPTERRFNTTNTYPLFDNYFQCGTCHDVHAGDNGQSAAGTLQFMRGNITDSELCIDCHTAK